MLRKIKILAGLAVAMALAHEARAFTISGTPETWQTAALSYGTRYWYGLIAETNSLITTPGNATVTELSFPKNFKEGARLNTPIITYAFDYSFVDYFGPAGVNAVKAAFGVLNALPSVSKASPNLTEFLTQGNQQINYTAQALSMLDIKSTVLQIMVEHMGLLGETHVFDLRSQLTIDAATCLSEYYVIQRNWDPITYNATAYVNGTLYSYSIFDGCAGGVAVADAIETLNDVSDRENFTAVATYEGLRTGSYYLGLTRDDFGGLRYLYNKNNFNYENLPANCYAGSFSSAWTPVITNTLSAAWVGLLGGAEKFTFVNVNFDSVLGTNWGTNVVHYSLPMITNSGLSELDVTRSNNAPDIIFAAADLSAIPGDPPFTRTYTNLAVVAPLQSGTSVAPGVIQPTELIVFNNVGPLYYNFFPNYMDGTTSFLHPYFQWGVFDGTTNPPIAFPQGTSLANYEEFILSQPTGFAESPWTPILATNTVTGGGTAGTAGGGGGGGGGVGAAVPVGAVH